MYRKVTVIDPKGPPDEAAMAQKYGRLVQHIDDVYIFEEPSQDHLQWRVTFEPPTRRHMEAVDLRWSDRVDTFEATSGQDTRWTITWHTKARGVTGPLQGLLFSLSGKRRALRQIVEPVLAAFPPRPAR